MYTKIFQNVSILSDVDLQEKLVQIAKFWLLISFLPTNQEWPKLHTLYLKKQNLRKSSTHTTMLITLSSHLQINSFMHSRKVHM
jgi:hypothetical protein